MMRKLPLLLLGALGAAACQMGDSSNPVPQPDTLILGRIAAIRELPEEPGVFEVEIKAGLPETLQAVMRRENRSIPTLEKDLLVRVRVTPDTICVANLVATDLDSFRMGQEVAVLPRPGSSAMVGTKLLLTEAGGLYLFAAYQVQFLPRSLEALPPAVTSPADDGRINSCGLERTPIPLAGGHIVYFAAGLLPPISSAAAPRGAVRSGMRDSAGNLVPWAKGGYRPYRVAWEKGRWSRPEPIEVPGLGSTESARITWVKDDETECLVEVERASRPRELLALRRASASAPWGQPEKLKLAGGDSVGDAQRFGSALGALVWTVYDLGGSDLWLSLKGEEGQQVEPRINTLGSEWAPRLGPNNVLYFCRGERQLVFSSGMAREVRLPGKQLHPLLEAAPSADGSLIFVRVPRYVPGEPDWDLAVVARADSGWGSAVLLDDWKPGA